MLCWVKGSIVYYVSGSLVLFDVVLIFFQAHHESLVFVSMDNGRSGNMGNTHEENILINIINE